MTCEPQFFKSPGHIVAVSSNEGAEWGGTFPVSECHVALGDDGKTYFRGKNVEIGPLSPENYGRLVHLFGVEVKVPINK